MQFSKSHVTPRARSALCKKDASRALKTHRKWQIAREIHKIVGVMHIIFFADGALEAKRARDSSHRLFLKGAWSKQIANRTSNGETRASKSDKRCSYQGHLGSKKWLF